MAEFDETPEEIESEIKISKLIGTGPLPKKVQLSTREIANYLRLHSENNPRTAMLETKLHERLASPWRAFIVVFICVAIRCCHRPPQRLCRRRSSILICFGYYVLAQIALYWGTSGSVLACLCGVDAELVLRRSRICPDLPHR